MQKLPEHITEELLAKYLAKEVSLEEGSVVYHWLQQSSENEDLFLTYQMLWEDLGIFNSELEDVNVDLDQAWSDLKQKKSDRDLIVISPFASWMKIAAAVVLVLGMFAVIYRFGSTEQMLMAHTVDETSNLKLSDNSEVTLNKNSTLEYPETFSGESRDVNMKGQAFFEVSRDTEHPFIIHIGQATVTVLGTSFDIKSSINLDTITLSVFTGIVRFSYHEQTRDLKAGDKVTLYASLNQMIEEQPNSSGLDQFWRTRKLSFSGQRLSDVVNTLSQAYNTEINLQNENIRSCRLHADFKDDSLENILEVISLTLGLHVENEEGKVILSGEGCAFN